MKYFLFAALLLASGCATLEVEPGRVMSANHSNGKVHYMPARYLYLPGEAFPAPRNADHGRTMCSIFS